MIFIDGNIYTVYIYIPLTCIHIKLGLMSFYIGRLMLHNSKELYTKATVTRSILYHMCHLAVRETMACRVLYPGGNMFHGIILHARKEFRELECS